MALNRAMPPGLVHSLVAGKNLLFGRVRCQWQPQCLRSRTFATEAKSSPGTESTSARDGDTTPDAATKQAPSDWEDKADHNIDQFSQLPHRHFGINQHMIVNAEFKEALRQILWQFKAPIRYAFAYGSGVFTQSSSSSSYSSQSSPHPRPPHAVTQWQSGGGKSIDFIFGVSFTQHWHSLNLQQHRDHYSFLGSLGSGVVAKVQDSFGAGAYFNPYVIVNGVMIKYGVVNLDTLYKDLSEWDTLYMAGRLQKPVKILRDDPRMRLANQVNLISALRTALLMLPPSFTENELYTKIASISYMGDPRMALRAEDPKKVSNIVDNQMANFRQLYLPLIDDLPNVSFNDPNVKKQGWVEDSDLNCNLQQDMNPSRRGNMVRRLPKSFRRKVYDEYQNIFKVPANEFRDILEQTNDDNSFATRMATDFDKRIASEKRIDMVVQKCVQRTINGPSMKQAIKGVLTAGPVGSWRYFMEKRQKAKTNKHKNEVKEV